MAVGHKFRTKNISKRTQKVVMSPIKEMSMIADELQRTTEERIISFGQGIPHFDTPDYIKKGIIEALKERDTRAYTLEPGITELREMVGRQIEASRQVKVNAKTEVMISVGCQEAVVCALAAVIDEGDEVLLFSPGFPSHIEQTIQLGGAPKFVPLNEERNWEIDFKLLEKKTTKKTKAILFANPSNPCGKVLTKEEARNLAIFARRHDLIVISDETYDFLTYDGTKFFSPVSIPGIRDRIILCGSFSKKYSLTGYRIGYAFAESGIMDHMLKVHDALAICAPAISQKAVMAAMKSDDSVSAFTAGLAGNREKMFKRLDRMSGLFSYQKPMGAYYILAKYNFPGLDSFEMALKILNEAHVIVIPGAAFGPTGEGHVRFSFGCSPEDIEEGFDRLEKWYAKAKK